MLEAPPSKDDFARMYFAVPYEDLTSDSDTDVSSAAVPYEDLTPRSAGHSATLVCLHGLDRIHRRTSSKPVRNQDFAQYPCFFRAGYLCPMS